MTRVELIVEEAGCASCAQRIRAALERLATVERIEIDEAADAATVTLELRDDIDQAAVAGALDEASAGAGHTYRVRPGSWAAAMREAER